MDISDPSQLFQLTGGGEFVVEQITDTIGNEIVVTCGSSTILACDPDKKLKIECMPSDTEKTIESVFISQPTSDVNKRKREIKQPRKNITSHRLLTSRDIINEKLKLIQQKQEKEQKMKNKKTNRNK